MNLCELLGFVVVPPSVVRLRIQYHQPGVAHSCPLSSSNHHPVEKLRDCVTSLSSASHEYIRQLFVNVIISAPLQQYVVDPPLRHLDGEAHTGLLRGNSLPQLQLVQAVGS